MVLHRLHRGIRLLSRAELVRSLSGSLPSDKDHQTSNRPLVVGRASESRSGVDEEAAQTLSGPHDGILRFSQSLSRPFRANTRRRMSAIPQSPTCHTAFASDAGSGNITSSLPIHYLSSVWTQALSVTFAQLFTTPMGAIGESISQFFAGTLSHIPVFLWPVMICLVVFIVIMIGLMYSRYELHLPFMMGSLRPSPHAAIPPRPEPVEQLEANASARVIELESRVNELQLQLQKRAALPLERPSRSSSTRGGDRDRSVSAQRSPPPPGFRDHVLE